MLEICETNFSVSRPRYENFSKPRPLETGPGYMETESHADITSITSNTFQIEFPERALTLLHTWQYLAPG